MTSQHQRYVYRELIGWFQCACVPLQAVVSSVNSVIDSPPYDTVSEEARKFVQILLQKQRIQVGSLAESDEWLLLPWPGTKEEHITHVLASIVLGNSMGDELTIWFNMQNKFMTSNQQYPQ